MELKEFERDLMQLCEKHGVTMKPLKWEMPKFESNDIHVGTDSAYHTTCMRHKSIIRTECRETVRIFAEFEAKEIELLDGRRYEEQT